MAPGFLTPVSWSVRGGSGACSPCRCTVGARRRPGPPPGHLRRRPRVNGFPCIEVPTADDFFSDLLALPPPNGGGSTRATGQVPAVGSVVTDANVTVVPGLNTQGVSLSRTDFAPGGVNPPHTHPRASEIIFVLAGTLDVGFITTANVLFAKTISAGQLFVFPRGLVHFQSNPGNVSAAAISAFNSQLPGTQFIPSTLFGASPDVPTDVLAKAFRVGAAVVDGIKASF
ncbi:hypothetical protein PAHAL_5G434000 [Panicum hallii]|uniref:Germin-like protein n=1 Tax=Panicum hallii TaxID=206008 RepID=A0A2S3HWW9_9POAL|nr:hypothetical protein PAHAL_5G434000 [Panicum hallii]